MRLSLIAALGRNRVIGKENSLPWRLPADLRHFKQTTLGHPVIMGRKTYESIGAPLAGRTNIIVTHRTGFPAPGCRLAASFEDALAAVASAAEVFVIGGESLYRQAMPIADRLYLTLIDHDFEGDAFFPAIDPAVWIERERKTFPADERNPYSFAFVIMERARR